MPTLQTFTDLVNSLEGRAKSRPFSLQIHGKFDCQETEFLRMLRPSYEPVTEESTNSPISPSGNGASIRYEVKQDGIDQVLANVVSENGTVVTTTTLGIRVPSDMPSREAFLRQHALDWNDVEWNDEEVETEQESESESDNSDESGESHESCAEGRDYKNTSIDGQSEIEESDVKAASTAEEGPTEQSEDEFAEDGRSSQISRDDASVDEQSDSPPTTPFTIVRIQVPGDSDNHNAWLTQHGFGGDSAIWPGVQADNEREPLIGVGVEMTIQRGHARGGSRFIRLFDPPEERMESYASFILEGPGGHDDVDSEDGSDRESAEEDHIPSRVTVLEAVDEEDPVEAGEDAQTLSSIEGTDFDGDLTEGSLDGELLA